MPSHQDQLQVDISPQTRVAQGDGPSGCLKNIQHEDGFNGPGLGVFRSLVFFV